ncbi:MAG: hypothetical protein HY074_14670 [Deltaproteobacteria bacterium]|nr:hypothetical protein [Deltaproteobacteria bacterium]
MKTSLLLLVLLFCPSATAFARDWVSPDFFIETGVAPESQAAKGGPLVTDCRAHIAQVTCLVDPVPPGENEHPLTGSYTSTPGLPVIHTHSKPGVSDFLYFVIAHEFGHIFDFANQLNKSVNEHELAPGSWGALSWKDNTTPSAGNRFPNHRGLCFYECNGKTLPASAIAPLYEALYESTNFISTYSTTEPWDDFADSLAYYLVAKNLGTRYELDTQQPTRAVYDSIAKVTSARFATKYQFLDAFLKRTDIKYP